MSTVNVSIPDKLRNQAQRLVDKGFYASFSDLVRDSLRKLITQNRYDLWTEEAKEDLKKGKAKVLKSKKDIGEYFENL